MVSEEQNCEEVYYNNVQAFIRKANLHIAYLKYIMIIGIMALIGSEQYEDSAIFIISFVCVFTIAFMQNIVTNLKSIDYEKGN